MLSLRQTVSAFLLSYIVPLYSITYSHLFRYLGLFLWENYRGQMDWFALQCYRIEDYLWGLYSFAILPTRIFVSFYPGWPHWMRYPRTTAHYGFGCYRDAFFRNWPTFLFWCVAIWLGGMIWQRVRPGSTSYSRVTTIWWIFEISIVIVFVRFFLARIIGSSTSFWLDMTPLFIVLFVFFQGFVLLSWLWACRFEEGSGRRSVRYLTIVTLIGGSVLGLLAFVAR